MKRATSHPAPPLRIGINLITSNDTLRGADRYALALLRHLAAADGVNQYFVFHARWQGFVRDIGAPNVHLVCLSPPPTAAGRTLWQTLVFRRLPRRYGLDLVHYTNPAPILRPTCPTVVTVHDVAEFIEPGKYSLLRRHLRRASIRLSVRSADCLIAVSQSTMAALRQVVRVSPESIVVIGEGVSFGDGVPADAGQPPIGRRDSLRLPPRYILYVGVVERTKQVEAVVRAFSGLESFLRASHAVVIAGRSGSAAGDVEQAVRETGLTGKVISLGYVPDRDLELVYKGASAFVYPSLVEGFGLPVLEAFAAGIPVIASNIPALAEVAGDAAILVDPRDLHALQEAIQSVLTDDSLRVRLVTRGYERLARFSWAETARRTLAVYSRVAGGMRGPLRQHLRPQ